MMAQLAILGHETRGKEVIEILKMLGGKLYRQLSGGASSSGYYIRSAGNIDYNFSYCFDENVRKFTLEEFLEKYPYKVGDKVLINDDENDIHTIASMIWDDDLNKIAYTIEAIDGIIDDNFWFADEMMPYKEQKTMEEGVYAYNEINCYHQDFADKVRIRLGGDYEIKTEEGKTYIVRKKPTYPKTYRECCDVLGLSTMENDAKGYKNISIIRLQELLIARDTYWKIAGEQMGLGKPWEPAIQDTIWGITRSKDEIEKYSCHYGKTNLLEFPTTEMRDTFYENFKDLIERCKELL